MLSTVSVVSSSMEMGMQQTVNGGSSSLSGCFHDGFHEEICEFPHPGLLISGHLSSDKARLYAVACDVWTPLPSELQCMHDVTDFRPRISPRRAILGGHRGLHAHFPR